MQSEDALISLAWLEAARNRELPENLPGDVFYGIDVALIVVEFIVAERKEVAPRSDRDQFSIETRVCKRQALKVRRIAAVPDEPAVGERKVRRMGRGFAAAGPGEDETVITRRVGNCMTHLKAFSLPDPRGPVLAEMKADLVGQKLKPGSVRVDSAGVGYNFALHLKDNGVPVKMVNVGESPTDLRDQNMVPYADKYANLKAQLYWGLRLRLQNGEISGLTDDRTIAQLTSIRYAHNSRGKVQIETKDDARKRGVKSRDRAESVMLCFADIPVREPSIRRL